MDIPVWLDPNNCQFPDSRLALQEPNGLLAVGGSLDPDTLLSAYRQGIFPWYSDGQPLLWWSPDPRAVLFPNQLHISRSLRKTLNNSHYSITFDQAFDQVIQACAAPRTNAEEAGTWITSAMNAAYNQLHRLGYAHSVEVWEAGKLIGGLYGLALGRVFFGESMFHQQRDASKFGFVHLVHHLLNQGFQLIDCQQATPHLESLGATTIPRSQFNTLLQRYCHDDRFKPSWQLSAPLS
jgi:leucyl/phenylalanyl-tRNA--protein transferase